MTPSCRKTTSALLYVLGNHLRCTSNTKTGQVSKKVTVGDNTVDVSISAVGWVSVSIHRRCADTPVFLQVSASICNGHVVLAGTNLIDGSHVPYTEAEVLKIVRDHLLIGFPKFTTKRSAWVKPASKKQ